MEQKNREATAVKIVYWSIGLFGPSSFLYGEMLTVPLDRFIPSPKLRASGKGASKSLTINIFRIKFVYNFQ